MANWKMITARLDIGPFKSLLQNWLLSEVNKSGAVSPEIRATASRMPVTPAAIHDWLYAEAVSREALHRMAGLPGTHNIVHELDGIIKAVRDEQKEM